MGQEEDGEFLVVADQRGDKTLLSMFSVNLMHWIPVYSWDQRLDIVSATVSNNRQTVGVSYRFTDKTGKEAEEGEKEEDDEGEEEEKKKKKDKGEKRKEKVFYYNTFIQFVGTNQRGLLSEKTTMPQKIQFLSEEAGKHSISYKLLHTVSGERIDVIGVITDNTPPFGQMKRPWKLLRISGPFLWAGLFTGLGDSARNLCVIEQKSSKGGEPAQQLIRVVPLCAEKPLKAQTEHTVSEVLSPEKARTALENPCYAGGKGAQLPYALNVPERTVAISAPLPAVSAIELPSGAQCVCVQHGFAEDATSTRVTVIELESHVRTDLSVPIPEDKFSQAKNVRVMFDTFADYLMLYVPGHYTQLLDLSRHHDPAPGFVATGVQPPLPQTRSQSTQTPFVTAFGLGPALTSLSKKRHFLDLSTGVLYEYSMRRSLLTEMCKTQDRYLQESLLHTAIAHLGDLKLGQDIITTILEESPLCATPQLFKEYIMASTYRKFRAADQAQTSDGVPVTTHYLPLDVSHLEESKAVVDVKVSEYSSLGGGGDPSNTSPQVVCKKLWRRLGSYMAGCDPATNRNNDSNDDNNVEDMMAKVTVHGDTALGVVMQLSADLSALYPKIAEKKASDAAKAYVETQDAVVTDLFGMISLGTTKQKIRTRFRVLENFYCALDELGCVCTPPGFWTEFGTLGLMCMPQTMFVQYVERGRMKVSKNFVRRVIFTESQMKRDSGLVCYFLSKFPVKTALLLLNEAKKKELPEFLVERTFSEDFMCTLKTEVELGEDYDSSKFLPISLLLSSVEDAVKQGQKKDPAYNPPLFEVVRGLNPDKLFASLKF